MAVLKTPRAKNRGRSGKTLNWPECQKMVERVNSDSVIRALRRLTARVELWIFSRGAAVSEMSPLFLNNLLAVALDRDDWMVSDRMWRACGPRWPATIITRVFTTDKASMPHLHEPHSAPMRPLARPKRERERDTRVCVHKMSRTWPSIWAGNLDSIWWFRHWLLSNFTQLVDSNVDYYDSTG